MCNPSRSKHQQQQSSHDGGEIFNVLQPAGSVIDRRRIEGHVAQPLSSGDHELSDHSSVNEDDEDTTLAFRHKLQEWAVNSKSIHAAVTSLLGVLRSRTYFSSLPSAARTLLHTPRSSGTSQRSGGKYSGRLYDSKHGSACRQVHAGRSSDGMANCRSSYIWRIHSLMTVDCAAAVATLDSWK